MSVQEGNKETKKKYKQISKENRYQIEALLNIWLDMQSIWTQLGFSHTSIWREVERNGHIDWRGRAVYKAKIAQENYEKRRGAAVSKQNILANDYEMREAVRKWLESWLSPDDISGRARKENYHSKKHQRMVSMKAIYNYIHNYENGWRRFLLYKQTWYKKHSKSITKKWKICPNLPRIAERPLEINERSTIGNYEIDSIISWWHKGWATTSVERYSRYIDIRKSKSVNGEITMHNILDMMKWREIASITTDNWIEFCYLDIIGKRLWIECYLCDPYCSWQRWSNENGNRIIRRFLPKWINIDLYSDEEIQKIQDTINKKPRKILGYKTPREILHNVELKLF